MAAGHDTSATPITSLNDVRRTGVTLLGVMLLLTAIFGATYALSHQLHQTMRALLAARRRTR